MDYHNVTLDKETLAEYIRKWGDSEINISALWSTLARDGFKGYDRFVSMIERMDGRDLVITQRDNMGSPVSFRSNLSSRQDMPSSPDSPDGYDQSHHDSPAGSNLQYWDRYSRSQESQESNVAREDDATCPKCNSRAYISDEEVVKVLENTDPVKIILRITYVCRSCGERFTRVVTENVKARKKESGESSGTPGFPTSLESLRPGMSTTGRKVESQPDRLKFLDNI